MGPGDQQPDEFKQALEEVTAKYDSARDFHQRFREKYDRNWQLYRGYDSWRDTLAGASENDRDVVVSEIHREYSGRLHIPMLFMTIETIVPQAVSHRPTGILPPEDKVAAANVQNMKYLLERQQEDVNYELIVQDPLKASLIGGLGVGKTGWETQKVVQRRLVPAVDADPNSPDSWVEQQVPVTLFDGPTGMDVDPRDWIWDSFATGMDNLEWCIHRTWRSHRYVLERMSQGLWTPLAPGLVTSLPGRQAYDEVHEKKQAASGLDAPNHVDQVHEVWEYWSRGGKVVTVLDRQYVMAVGENPWWHGQLPFQVLRTTKLPHEMVGISEVEVLEDLQLELDTLRTQRRDNAAFVLNRVMAYQNGMIDEGDLQFAPGAAIPVQGDVNEMLRIIDVGDIPYSGYQEEDRLLGDFERVSGISAPMAGAQMSGDTTATEAQLVRNAASVRIQLKSHRLEVEFIEAQMKQWIASNQQKILSKTLRVPAEPQPGVIAGPEWEFVELTPLELAGQMAYKVKGGSAGPENTPQKRQDAQNKMQLFANNPQIDQQVLLRDVLSDLDVTQPDSWLVPVASVPPATLDVIVQRLVDGGLAPEEAQQLVAESLQQGQAMEQQKEQQATGTASAAQPDQGGQ